MVKQPGELSLSDRSHGRREKAGLCWIRQEHWSLEGESGVKDWGRGVWSSPTSCLFVFVSLSEWMTGELLHSINPSLTGNSLPALPQFSIGNTQNTQAHTRADECRIARILAWQLLCWQKCREELHENNPLKRKCDFFSVKILSHVPV